MQHETISKKLITQHFPSLVTSSVWEQFLGSKLMVSPEKFKKDNKKVRNKYTIQDSTLSLRMQTATVTSKFAQNQLVTKANKNTRKLHNTQCIPQNNATTLEHSLKIMI